MKPASYFWGLLLLPATAAAAEEGGLKLLSFSTLIGEIIAFALFVAFVMKFVWPPLMNLIETRQKEIADGLAAAEQGRQELADADTQRSQILAQAREQSGEMVSDGEKRGHAVLEAARRDAENEKARIIELGKREVDAERIAMRREVEEKLGTLIVAGAEKILQREVDAAVHQDIVDSMKKTL